MFGLHCFFLLPTGWAPSDLLFSLRKLSISHPALQREQEHSLGFIVAKHYNLDSFTFSIQKGFVRQAGRETKEKLDHPHSPGSNKAFTWGPGKAATASWDCHSRVERDRNIPQYLFE